MKIFLIVIVISLVVGCSSGINTSSKIVQQSQKPNVLLIVVDDLGGKDLSIYGSQIYKTPNLDEFAKTSVKYNVAYSSNPVCSPTRAAIMTGKSPTRVGITDWISGWGDKGKPLKTPEVVPGLPLQEVTLAEVFKDNGYRTLFAGKWHLGGEEYLPNLQGFDVNKGGHHRGSPPGGYYSPYNNPYLKDGPEGEYLPDRLTNETINFISEDNDKPFFAMLSFYTVHTPIEASRKHLKLYEDLANKSEELQNWSKEGDSLTSLQQNDPRYASMISAMDENVGRLLNHLKKNGQMNNTLIVFTSDNGGLSTLGNIGKRKYIPTSNYPYRAGKAFLYEGGIRIPLLIKYPGQTKEVESNFPTISTDIFATISGVVNYKRSDEQIFDGLDLANVQHSNTSRELYWHYPHYHIEGWRPGGAMRSGKWKLIEDFESGTYQLFDLSNDISEVTNLAGEHPKIVNELAKKLTEWRKKVSAKMPIPR